MAGGASVSAICLQAKNDMTPEQKITQLEMQLADLRSKLELYRQVFMQEGRLTYISDATEVTNKLATTPGLWHERMFIDGNSSPKRLYVFTGESASGTWRYSALT
jgi:hypothetical protein